MYKDFFKAVFAPLIAMVTRVTGLFVYGFGFFMVCLSFDFLPWVLAIPATVTGIVLIVTGLAIAEVRPVDHLAERLKKLRESRVRS